MPKAHTQAPAAGDTAERQQIQLGRELRRLRTTYIVALSTIAALIVSAEVTRCLAMAGLTADAAAINVAGRQRLLSQRIVASAAGVANASSGESRDDAAHLLNATIDEFETAHASLVTRGDNQPIGGTNSQQVRVRYADLEPDRAMLIAEGRRLLALTEAGQAVPTGLVDRMTGHADAFMPVMQSISGIYETESRDRVATLQGVAFSLGILTLGVLIAQAFVIFEPVIRRLASYGKALAQSSEEAMSATSAKSEFLANMSHEIRTPMTAILGYTDVLADLEYEDADSDTKLEHIETVRRNATHLLSLINDILDVSKIEAGRLGIEMIPVSPAAIIEETASLTRPHAAARGLDFIIRYATPVPESIISDPTRLRQILVNLVGNAIKFTERGSVTIELACDPEAETLSISVRDTGIGMTPEQLERIRQFDAFIQAESSTTRRFGGTGLGLRISHALANRLGGELRIESNAETGSTFTVTVDTGTLDDVRMTDAETQTDRYLAARRAERNAARRATDKQPLAGFRILLADDSLDNRRLIAHKLVRAGAETRVVGNGQEAMEAVGQDPSDVEFDIVLMDMQMPVLDGYSATRRLRMDGHTLPIIALTAHAMADDRIKCAQAGCVAYATKPVNWTQLFETITECINDAQGTAKQRAA